MIINEQIDDRLIVQCVDCPATAKAKPAKDGSAKTPMRWRKTADGFRCRRCQSARYVGRSIRLRLLGSAEGETRDKAEMYRALNAASRQSNQFANWLLQKLLAADQLQLAAARELPRNANGKTQVPPVPSLQKQKDGKPWVDWYREATKLFSGCAPSSLVQQAQIVHRYYAKERFAALVAMNRNVRSYVWDGLPVVVNAQAWKLIREEDDKIVLRAQIGPGKSWTLNVFAQGVDLARMRQIADGEVIPGTAIFVRRASQSRSGETKRVRVWYLRISAQVPRTKKRRGKGLEEITLTLGHDADSLLFGSLNEGEDVFEYPAPCLRALIAAHKKLDRQRQIESSFRHQHWSHRKAKRWAVGRTAACERNNAKVKAEIALAAACLTRWCESHDVTAIDYDVTPRGWMEKFPYSALANRIETSLSNAGIALHVFGQNSVGEEISFDDTEQPGFAARKSETEALA